MIVVVVVVVVVVHLEGGYFSGGEDIGGSCGYWEYCGCVEWRLESGVESSLREVIRVFK